MKIDCPHCGVHGSVDDSLAGKKLRCPKCSKIFLLSGDVQPEVDDGGLLRQDTVYDAEPESPSETDEQLLAETDVVEEPVEESAAIDDTDMATCSVCSQSFAAEFLVEIDSKLYCALCQPESESEDEGEGSEEELFETMEEDLSEQETGDFLVEDDDLFESDDESEGDYGEESVELEACSVCGESLHPGFLETVGSKRYCALCLPEEAEEDEADPELEEYAVADDEPEEFDTDAAQALMSDGDEFEGDDDLQKACSVCGEKFHLDFLQEVDSKLYCGICQPEVIEEVADDEGGELAAEETEELALEERGPGDSEELVTGTDEEELQSSGSDFTVGELIKEAWQKTKGAKGPIWGALIVMYIILFSLSFGGMLALQRTTALPDPNTAMGITAGLQLVATWLSTLFTAGLMLIGVRRAFGQSLSWKMVFAGFSKVASITIAVILQTILIAIGFILLVLPGIYLTVGYALALPLIMDKGLGPWQALEVSRKAIHKKWWTVLGLYLVMMLLYAVSAIPLGLGFIWTIPMFFVLIGVLYVRLFGDESYAVEETEEVEEENEEISEAIEEV